MSTQASTSSGVPARVAALNPSTTVPKPFNVGRPAPPPPPPKQPAPEPEPYMELPDIDSEYVSLSLSLSLLPFWARERSANARSLSRVARADIPIQEMKLMKKRIDNMLVGLKVLL